MPTQYERDDRRRLITVVVTDPYTVEDLFAVIDRQFAEGTWPYAMLYDARAVDSIVGPSDTPRLADHAARVGHGHARGPVGLWVSATSRQFQSGSAYAAAARASTAVEVLLTDTQKNDWLVRSTKQTA
jgi:hypothetical protein